MTRRDVDEYLSLAKERTPGWFWSWRRTATRTTSPALWNSQRHRAAIYHGDQLEFSYGNPLEDGQELSLGGLTIKAMHTPGHTYESHCYLVSDDRGPFLLFSGYAVLRGCRPTDLAGPESTRDLSEKLYISLHERIVPLGRRSWCRRRMAPVRCQARHLR